jgi:hypothetical protein
MYTGLLNGFMAQLSDGEMAAVAREFAAQLKHVERSGVVRKFETVQTGLTSSDWHLDRLDQRVLPFDSQYSYDLVHWPFLLPRPSWEVFIEESCARFYGGGERRYSVWAQYGTNATFSSRQKRP